jgi:hypothetical protein
MWTKHYLPVIFEGQAPHRGDPDDVSSEAVSTDTSGKKEHHNTK